MEYAVRGEMKEAVASFLSDHYKIGQGSAFDFIILQAHTDSVELFKEGLLGFYYAKAEIAESWTRSGNCGVKAKAEQTEQTEQTGQTGQTEKTEETEQTE